MVNTHKPSGDKTPLGYWHLTMSTQQKELHYDYNMCSNCVKAINCATDKPEQFNHLHPQVIAHYGNTFPCNNCKQLQLYAEGQVISDSNMDYNRRTEYVPSGEFIPHTLRCTDHNILHKQIATDLKLQYQRDGNKRG